MAKKKSISKSKTKKRHTSKVPENATELKESYNVKAQLSFTYLDKTKWKLTEWNSEELKDLIETFQTIESLDWNEIQSHSGLRYKQLHNPPKVNNDKISPDSMARICEMRVCPRKRIHGFRVRNIFCLVWFDKDHQVCPEGKNRRRA